MSTFVLKEAATIHTSGAMRPRTTRVRAVARKTR
jgi:hypothetical protein